MQSRERIFDVCPNRANCPKINSVQSFSDLEVISICSTAKTLKWDLISRLYNRSLKRKRYKYAEYFLGLMSTISKKSAEANEPNITCINCPSNRRCPLVSQDFLKEYTYCAKIEMPDKFHARSFQSHVANGKFLAN